MALYNPAGDVEVTRGSGTDVRVTVRRGGEDGDRLSVATGHRHGRQTLRVRYPSDEIVFPGGAGSTTLRIADDGTFGHDGGRRVRVSDHGSGLRAHADLVVEVPEGQRLEIRIGLGDVSSRDAAADLSLHTSSGSVDVDGHRGALEVDTGSGSVTVSGAEDGLRVDTGSGSVEVSDVAGDLDVDTGSGSVEVSVPADYGSRLAVATGSGGVDLSGLSASDLVVDDGDVSGAVGDGEGDTAIDTGSGDVTIRRSDG